MDNKILLGIDLAIKEIKIKSDNFGITVADIFIILTLEILRIEVLNNKISDLTIRACKEIRSNTSHQFYYRDYPNLYLLINKLFIKISELDDRFYSADIDTIGFEVSDWELYLKKSIEDLLSTSSTAI